MNKLEVGRKREEVIEVTERKVNQYAKLSGDFNPIHLDEEFAKKTVFKSRVAHGMLSAIYIPKLLLELANGSGIHLSQELEFIKPVYINSSIKIVVEIIKIEEKKAFKIVSIKTDIYNSNGEYVIKGLAKVIPDVYVSNFL